MSSTFQILQTITAGLQIFFVQYFKYNLIYILIKEFPTEVKCFQSPVRQLLRPLFLCLGSNFFEPTIAINHKVIGHQAKLGKECCVSRLRFHPLEGQENA